MGGAKASLASTSPTSTQNKALSCSVFARRKAITATARASPLLFLPCPSAKGLRPGGHLGLGDQLPAPAQPPGGSRRVGRWAGAGSATAKPGSRHLQLNLSLLLGDRPENVLKESPAPCRCSRIGYKTERKQKRLLPSGPPTAVRPRGGAVWPGQWAWHTVCREGPWGTPWQADGPGDRAQRTPGCGHLRL